MNRLSSTAEYVLEHNERSARFAGIALVLMLHGTVAGAILYGPWTTERPDPMRSAVAATLLSGPGQTIAQPVSASLLNPEPVHAAQPPAEPTAQPMPEADRPRATQLPQPSPDMPAVEKREVRHQRSDQPDESAPKPRERAPHAAHSRQVAGSAAASAATPTTTPAAAPTAAPTQSPTPVAAAAKESASGQTPSAAQSRDAAMPAASIAAGINCQKPDYPKASRRLMEEGVVSLRFLVESDGRVLNAEIEKSSGFSRLDEAARSALALCQFRPGQVNGAPVRSWATINYSWKLR